MSDPLDHRLVFAKTPAGAAEIAERSSGLPGAARRILILIDGRRRLGDLPAFVRPNELDPIIEDLAARGFIVLAGIAEDAAEEELRERQRRQHESLVRLQGALAGVFERELGAPGLILDARLRDCVSLDVLRTLLREAVDTVQSRRGRAAADRVLAIVRPIYADYASGPRL
jgi:hypothetical protein